MQHTAPQTSAVQAGAGWLKSRPFDLFFIFGTMCIGLMVGGSWFSTQQIFAAVLLVNLWTLGYHHVIATFTRLCFDKATFKKSWWLIFLLLPAVLGAVVLLAQQVGLWIIATIYLYAQWFHYSRQSWGISRAYERNAPAGYVADRSWQTQAAFYIFPVWGILYRSWQHPDAFLTMPIKVLPVTNSVLMLVGAASIALLCMWLARVYADWKKGVLPTAYVCYMFSHFVVFSAGYLLMPTLDSGWLVVNVWHNLQYMLFVWMYNNRNFRAGIDPNAKFLSFLSQQKNAGWYVATTLAMTFAVYLGLRFGVLSAGTPAQVLTAIIVVYMTINFHHYIVDAIIWRMAWIKRVRGSAAPPAPAPTQA